MDEKTSERNTTCRPAYLHMDAPTEDFRAAAEQGRRMLLARSRHFRRRGIIKRFGTWCVSSFGVETVFAPVDYCVEKCRLDEPWWHDQLAAKNWVIIEDFDKALDFAREYFGIQVRRRRIVTDKKHGKGKIDGV